MPTPYVVFPTNVEVQIVRVSDNAIVARYSRCLFEQAEHDCNVANESPESRQARRFWQFASDRIGDFNFMVKTN